MARLSFFGVFLHRCSLFRPFYARSMAPSLLHKERVIRPRVREKARPNLRIVYDRAVKIELKFRRSSDSEVQVGGCETRARASRPVLRHRLSNIISSYTSAPPLPLPASRRRRRRLLRRRHCERAATRPSNLPSSLLSSSLLSVCGCLKAAARSAGPSRPALSSSRSPPTPPTPAPGSR